MRVPLRRILIAVCSLLLLQIASDVWPQTSAVSLNGLGCIDYRSKPRFKVGDWVKYHFSSQIDGGGSEDYDMTILISGEEKFWGEDCFWVETSSGGRTLEYKTTAILMSYSIFGDTAWSQHLQIYRRKTARLDELGEISQRLNHRVLKGKPTGDEQPTLTARTDSLGADTVSVAGTLYRCLKVGRKMGMGTVDEQGDSTIRIEKWDRYTRYLSTRVPITSLPREFSERAVTRKAWKAGKSADAVQSTVLHGTGSLDVVAWGSGGRKPQLTPLYARKGLERGGAAPTRKPATRPRGLKKS